MNRRSTVLNIVALFFCAMLPLAPVMTAGIHSFTPATPAAGPNTAALPAEIPVQNLRSDRWDLVQIKVPQAWEVTAGGQGVVIAILDNGIDDSHPALRGKIIGRTSFTEQKEFDKVRGHGTHIAGLIAASVDKSGNSGIAYNARLLDVQVAESDGTTDALKVAKGIIWAADNGAQIINISIVVSRPYSQLEYAVQYAWAKGCLIVAAAGNEGNSEPMYPAGYTQVLAVGASDQTNRLADWSARGNWVDLAAPGVNIFSVLPGKSYGFRSGTSFATALVSGSAALLYAGVADRDKDGLINYELAELLLSSSELCAGESIPETRLNVYHAAKLAGITKDYPASPN
ncbi:MAG TPA: S8 family serine peptidase [Dehalococcoidales bacterium]|nr:S8 family serine peptidase [Dehalococcoidales bacterium]